MSGSPSHKNAEYQTNPPAQLLAFIDKLWPRFIKVLEADTPKGAAA